MKIFARLALVAAFVPAISCHAAGGNASKPSVQPDTPPLVQPGAPGQAGRTVDPAKAADLSKVGFTPADVKFMQGMIGHHAQALEMVDLLDKQSNSEDMKKLGLRIRLSQIDEIKMMREWLAARGQQIPDEHAHHTGMLMPGMLTPEEMAKLAAAKGTAFDRLFLEGMIKHHGGALIMVEDLLNTPGAAQDADIYAFASDVVADQRMEMDRMAGMLSVLPKELER
jgi:uncharacterized protein (DUF305 family)